MSTRGWTHQYVDYFVEPMKRWFPWGVWFWRPDHGKHGFKFMYWDKKPLGYWLGHVVAYTIPLTVVIVGWLIWSG